MRMTRGMIRTQKQVATEAELPSHQLTLRAGLARRVAAGIYSLTPLALRVIRRIEQIVREEMDALGAQEVLMPVVQPAELWQESGRYAGIGAELARFQDRGERAMVLAMTHEEAATDLIRAQVTSYRDLPLLIYQIQTKFRDEARPRAGLIRLREFLMKDAYSFHTAQSDLDATYERVMSAYQRIFRRAGVSALTVQSDTGMMGGTGAHEFMVLADGGEDTLLVCLACGHAANVEVAAAQKGAVPSTGPAAPLQAVHTPGATTIAGLAELLGVGSAQILKSVFYAAGNDLVMALIRGDLAVNEVKLRNLLGQEVRTLSAAEAADFGLTVGFAGPVGLKLDRPVRLVADDSVVGGVNLVAGANRAEYHLTGVVFGRDFQPDVTGDIAVATSGQGCPACGAPLTERRGIEAGNIFKLGTKYSLPMQATFTDEAGGAHPIVMGCYGFGITRLLACILEQHHDPDGIIWPAAVAPYAYHLLVAGKDEALTRMAEDLYQELGTDRTLYDDRDLSAGVKFKDADLLGMPLRVTVSQRSLAAGGAELRVRHTAETRIVALTDVAGTAAELLAVL